MSLFTDVTHFLSTGETPGERRRREEREEQLRQARERLAAAPMRDLFGYFDMRAYVNFPAPPPDPFIDGPVVSSETAERAARDTLTRFLSPDQVATLKKQAFFDAKVNKRTYRFDVRTGEVYRVGNDNRVHVRYCIYPFRRQGGVGYAGVGLPKADIILAKLLYLQADERGFLRTANEFEPLPSQIERLYSVH